ncbi:MAG: tetratricopeptide repeat protein, partial [Anaerolineales bacterium]|nr:tetratricopeptide repeat protein [Anaerolineales bacterium]
MAQRSLSLPGTLPTSLTPFIGRQQELADVAARLADSACRLLTLVGPGGTGKTRLAVEAARRQHGRFPDGIFWVDLQTLDAVELLATAVADALALPQSADDPHGALLHALQDRTCLLLLDNFEQLGDGGGLLSGLLRGAPAVKLLVTSRAALNLQAEWLFPVHGLPVPPAEAQTWPALQDYDAVQLFVAHARRVRPAFRPEAEAAGILQVCRLVEGMPLALELAAAWARALDSAGIAAEIRRSLDFLTADTRSLPDRHRSLQSIFDHAWAQLAPEEQAAFAQMAVFRGGFRREAAAAVAGATLPLLTRLVDRSLLRWAADGRYQMHELLRQYAAARAAEEPAQLAVTHARHAAYYVHFLAERTAAILGAGQQQAVREIGAELDNVRAAWQWHVAQQQIAPLGPAVETLSMFCQLQCKYLEARRLFELVTAPAPAEAQPVLARIHNELGWFYIRLGQFEPAARAFARSAELWQQLGMPLPDGHTTDPRLGQSALASIRGEYDAARQLAEAALAAGAAAHNDWNVATAHYLLASIAHAQGAYAQAQAAAAAAYAAAERTQDRWFMVYCLYELGQAAAALGDYAQARQHFTACHALREGFADSEGKALAMNSLGDVAWRQQQYAEARRLFTDSAALYRQINDRGGLAAAYHGLGRTAVAQQDYEEARRQLRQALQIGSDIDFTTFLLAVLADVAGLLLRVGRVAPGLALLQRVEAHPATGQAVRLAAVQQRRHYETAVSPALFPAADALPRLEEAVRLALRELALPLPAVGEGETAVAPPPAPPAAAAAV